MKLLSRDFTPLEKLVLLVLVLILMGIGYYRLIDQPIRQGMAEAEAQRNKLQVELNDVNIRISEYNNRVNELDEAKALRHFMPSYNASDEELRILNGVLSEARHYSFDVDKITLSEEDNQIRRRFTFSFTALNFDTVKDIFTRLSDSPTRCMLGTIECGGLNAAAENAVITVQGEGAFYETLTDAQMDAVLSELLNGREIPTSAKPEAEEQSETSPA